MEDDIKLEITLPRVPDIELVAIEGLKIMGMYFGVPQDKISEASLIVTEAVINALEYTSDHVVVEFTMTKEILMILVKDSGTGFKPETIPEPDIRKKISSDYKRGWGLKLMKSMSDDLIIESGTAGTKISIMKKLI